MGKRYDEVMKNIEKKNANWELEKRVEILEKKISQMECDHPVVEFCHKRNNDGHNIFWESYTQVCQSCGFVIKDYDGQRCEYLKDQFVALEKEIDQKCKEEKK